MCLKSSKRGFSCSQPSQKFYFAHWIYGLGGGNEKRGNWTTDQRESKVSAVLTYTWIQIFSIIYWDGNYGIIYCWFLLRKISCFNTKFFIQELTILSKSILKLELIWLIVYRNGNKSFDFMKEINAVKRKRSRPKLEDFQYGYSPGS